MKSIRSSLISIVILTMTIGFTSTAAAKIYKWTDENGKIHYTETPPAAKAEEFKVQKIKQSSLTHLNDDSKTTTLKEEKESYRAKYFHKVDPSLSASSQCKKASKNMPAMFALMRNKIEESKLDGMMNDEQFNKALNQLIVSQNNQPTFEECVANYESGDKMNTNKIANEDAESALTYMLMKSRKEKDERGALLIRK